MKFTKICFSVLVALFAGSLVACNTVHGAGEDIQAGGEAVSKAATKTQQKM